MKLFSLLGQFTNGYDSYDNKLIITLSDFELFLHLRSPTHTFLSDKIDTTSISYQICSHIF